MYQKPYMAVWVCGTQTKWDCVQRLWFVVAMEEPASVKMPSLQELPRCVDGGNNCLMHSC